jgi:hypothetical protein
MILKDTGSNFKPVPAGMHLARCYRIIDMGTQETNFEGKVDYKRKLKFVWEVHGEDEDGTPLKTEKNEPFVITKDYTNTWGEKGTLRKDLQSWRGREFTPEEQRRFNIENVLDKWCMINVTHKAKKSGNGVYANVSALTPVPSQIKTIGLPVAFNKAEIFSLSEPNMEMFETFSEWLRNQIMTSPEWKASENKGLVPKESKVETKGSFDDMDDDIPF